MRVNVAKLYLATCILILIYKWLRPRSPKLAAFLDMLYGTLYSKHTTLSLLGINVFGIMWFQVRVLVVWTVSFMQT